MKVTIENGDIKATIEGNRVMCDDCLDMCLRAMMGVTFHPDLVAEAVMDAADLLGRSEEMRDEKKGAG